MPCGGEGRDLRRERGVRQAYPRLPLAEITPSLAIMFYYRTHVTVPSPFPKGARLSPEERSAQHRDLQGRSRLCTGSR